MGLCLKDAAKECECISLESFIALTVKMCEGLLIGRGSFTFDDGIVLLADFKDRGNHVLIDHGVDFIIDAIHDCIQLFIFARTYFFPQFLIKICHCLTHGLSLLNFVSICMLFKEFENLGHKILRFFLKCL